MEMENWNSAPVCLNQHLVFLHSTGKSPGKEAREGDLSNSLLDGVGKGKYVLWERNIEEVILGSESKADNRLACNPLRKKKWQETLHMSVIPIVISEFVTGKK